MQKRIPIRPEGLPVPDPAFNPGLRYGNWVFVSGTMATDYRTGLVPEAAGNRAVPLAGEDRMIAETRCIYRAIGRVLQEAGTDLSQGVRIDQFPATRAVIDPYHVARREILAPPRPASTSVEIAGLLCPEANIQVELLAAIPGPGFAKEGITTDRIPQPLAGYSPAVRIGDFVFLAGQIPTDWKSGLAPETRVDPNFWEGNAIDREARFTLRNMEMTLEAAGSSMRNVVKAQVYLTDINDIPRLDRVWREFFPEAPPARTIYPIRSLGVPESRIEINFVALTDDGRTKKEVIEAPEARKPLFHESQAVRAGEFLFLSGLMATDGNGLVEAARVNPHWPYAGDPAAAQMEDIMRQAQSICKAAGTDVRHALRLLMVHTDLGENHAATAARRRFFPDGDPAQTTIRVPGPLQVPGCTLMADLWVAAG